jgi:hypothetical protein
MGNVGEHAIEVWRFIEVPLHGLTTKRVVLHTWVCLKMVGVTPKGEQGPYVSGDVED